jgi:dimethylhistidine N-methyltransferase
MTAFAPFSEFAAEVRAGLSVSRRKRLPCEYLYDALGTALFCAICELPEYGLRRADARVLERHAREIAGSVSPCALVAELGCGDGAKTRYVLQALGRRTYFPIDVSASALELCRGALGAFARVQPIQATYLDGLRVPVSERRAGEPLLVLFLGSTIGNFTPTGQLRFLRDVRACLRPGDALLLGADLVKPEAQLLAAYDDPLGVTAAFNKNLLARINRELGGNFDVQEFAHEARWRKREQRIEMHLRSRRDQVVDIPGANLSVKFRRGETIWTESSHKFTLEGVRALAERSGFACAAQWTDGEWPFAESFLRAV